MSTQPRAAPGRRHVRRAAQLHAALRSAAARPGARARQRVLRPRRARGDQPTTARCSRCTTTRCSPRSSPASAEEFANSALKAAQAIQARVRRRSASAGRPSTACRPRCRSACTSARRCSAWPARRARSSSSRCGDCVSIAERLVHRARAGEIVISLDVMKALARRGRDRSARGAAGARARRQAPAAADLRHGAGDAAGLYR